MLARSSSANRGSHLHEYFPPLLDDVGLVLQVVFGGLADVDLHALFTQTHPEDSR